MTVTAGGAILHAPTAQAATTESASTAASTTKAAATAVTSKTTSAAALRAAKVARQKVKAGKAVAVAKKQVGDPYRYGATGPGSFDCSGLVQYAWKKAGVKLPRVAASQFARIRNK